ncbi:MAG: hypothetical protein ABEI27_06085 [Halobellus sp.]|uniref:hypothetical protein n=1 Tax=Halobellus sp. TaxID=1979212 RepID=UPI0035D453C8
MTRAADGGPSESASAYHVVCHDCQTESVAFAEDEAEAQLSEHRSETGHNVEIALLADSG